MTLFLNSFLVLSTFLVLSACSSQQATPPTVSAVNPSKIIGGEQVQEMDPVSKTVVGLLDKQRGTLCTASLLSNDVLITAAHCVHGSQPQNLRVMFGQNLKDTANTEAHMVARYIENPDFASRMSENQNFGDLALVKFFSGFPRAKGYRAANLLFNESGLTNGLTITVAGYGTAASGSSVGVGVLRKANVALKDVHWSAHEVLVDQTNGQGACHGDSGGPAYFEMNGQLYLFGVTSRGINDPQDTCTQEGAFTNIMAYDIWLTNSLQILENTADTVVDPGTDPVDDWSQDLDHLQLL